MSPIPKASIAGRNVCQSSSLVEVVNKGRQLSPFLGGAGVSEVSWAARSLSLSYIVATTAAMADHSMSGELTATVAFSHLHLEL